jgi:hypothetical protein
MSKKFKVPAKAGLHSWELSSRIPDLNGMPAIKKAVLRALADRFPNIWPSVSNIAAKVGCGTTTVRKYLQELENEGWIKALTGKQGGFQGTVQYEFNVDKLETELTKQQLAMATERDNTTLDDSKTSADDEDPTPDGVSPTTVVAEQKKNRLYEQRNEQKLPILSSKKDGHDAELVGLAAKLYELGDHVFSGKYYEKLGDLLETYPMDEIVEAYGEFVSNQDDFERKFAPKGFCEGGAAAVIHTRRKRAEHAQNIRKTIERSSELRRVELEEEEEKRKREEEEADRDLRETFGVCS